MDLTGLVTASMPAILALLQRRHAEANPDAPALTDAQAFAALHDGVAALVSNADARSAEIRARNPGA